MDVNDPQWETYQNRFLALAEKAHVWHGNKPDLSGVRSYLCLYGENGLTPEEEFGLLAQLSRQNPLYRLEIETSYWQDTILFYDP